MCIRDSFHTRHNNLIFLAITKRNSNATMVFAFLFRFIEVLVEYFKELEEESIRDNFVIIYELLDEMMDNGYPQTTEFKILKEYIKTEYHELKDKKVDPMDIKLPAAVSNVVGWRPEGIKYKKNEVFLDVVEKLNMLIGPNGNVIKSEILGCLKMKCFLSGMPELKLGLNDKALFEATGRASKGKAVELDDIKFHQCVRLSRFENERAITFIPPDGDSELISYRLDVHVKPLFMVEVIAEYKSSTRIEYYVKAKSNFKSKSIANNVEIYVPVPCDVQSPTFKTAHGTVNYISDRDAMAWSIKQFPGQKEMLMKASFALPSISSPDRENYTKVPININFEIPYLTVSGIQVRYLKIVESSNYQALPWVRYITQNGDYQIRMGINPSAFGGHGGSHAHDNKQSIPVQSFYIFVFYRGKVCVLNVTWILLVLQSCTRQFNPLL
eukprot:TRINITY_DN1701_c0_g1_i6.p1 TRINITY_DN1701_c0_g1~~TRINITY_DN1701_c0_g1_i6.p1  ORF type:complete len:440 (+),score=89.87 TRINITY_DN1701_c0_g1_i6:68-1387(+)